MKQKLYIAMYEGQNNFSLSWCVSIIKILNINNIFIYSYKSFHQVFDRGPLFQKFLSGFVDLFLLFGIHLQSLDYLPVASRTCNRVAEHQSFGNPVATVGTDGHALPFAVGSCHPVPDVLNSGIACAGCRWKFSCLDDGSSSLLYCRSEIFFDPFTVNQWGGSLSINFAVSEVRYHCGGVISPDTEILNKVHMCICLGRKLVKCPIMVKTGHGL